MLKRLSPLWLACLLAGLLQPISATAGEVVVSFVQPERYTDLGFAPLTRQRHLQALTEHMGRWGAVLPASRRLEIEVLDIDLAGLERPVGREPAVRVLNGKVDWPRMTLRWRLHDGQSLVASGEEQVSDMAYAYRLALGDRNRPLYHGTRNGHALLFAAGYFRREVRRALGQAYLSQGLIDRHGVGDELGHQGHVFPHGQARNQVVELEHEAHVFAAKARQGGVVGAIQALIQKMQLAAAGPIQPAHQVQQGALATARWAEHDHELPTHHIEVHLAQRMDGCSPLTVDLLDGSKTEDDRRLTGRRFTRGG